MRREVMIKSREELVKEVEEAQIAKDKAEDAWDKVFRENEKSLRSKTFEGMAQAMADQWGKKINF